jgi:hypothetical protein
MRARHSVRYGGIRNSTPTIEGPLFGFHVEPDIGPHDIVELAMFGATLLHPHFPLALEDARRDDLTTFGTQRRHGFRKPLR